MYLKQVNSTNTWLGEHLADFEGQSFAEVWTSDQTAGRGQVGNSWEAEPGKNVLLSALYRAEVPVQDAFRLTMAVSLAVVDAVDDCLGGTGCAGSGTSVRARVKWPNDIYVGDKKLCGILIESAIRGMVFDYSIIGVGLNINQTVFRSDAPNPVSLLTIRGYCEDKPRIEPFELDAVHDRLVAALQDRLTHYNAPGMKAEYMSRLYRGEGDYPYREVATGRVFEAKIADVTDIGELILEEKNGARHVYLLKQVQYII